MAEKGFGDLKNMQVEFSDSKDVRNTDMLDGGAKDSPVMSETNKTTQYKTESLPKGDLGGRNKQ